ncbi:MAG TPA: hypothetical protein VF196_00470 [Casimicrobiaceae bacterium]
MTPVRPTIAHAPVPRARPFVRVLAAAGVVLSFASSLLPAVAGRYGWSLAFMFAFVTALYLVVGTLITERRPSNRVGPLALAIGIGFSAYLAFDGAIRVLGVQPITQSMALVVQLVDGPLFFAIAMLFLFFPDGRLPSPRWRWLVATSAVTAAILVVSSAVRPGQFAYYSQFVNPIGVDGNPLDAIWVPVYGLMVLWVVVAALSLVGRWRRGSPVERAQLKWVAAAATVLAVAMVTYGGTAGPGQYSDLGDLSVAIGFAMFPIAIGIAVLRYRLYEIDRLISRTIGWALVTGILVATFAIVVVGLQTVLAPLTEHNTLAVAASTLVAFALVQPVHRRVQRVVDRRFNRSRVNAERTLVAFGERVRDEVDLAHLRGAVIGATNEAVAPDRSAMWLRGAR